MQKISFESWKNSMSFMIDDDFDHSFLGSIKELTVLINQSAHLFSDKTTLGQFVLDGANGFESLLRLKALVSLIGLSEERLKRAVSLVRYKFYGDVFKSEWTVKQVCKKFIGDEDFRNLLLEFFINGRDSKIGAEIPLYYMRNFNLQSLDFIQDLSEFNYVNRILNDNEIQGKYSNQVGAHVEKIIENRLTAYQQAHNQALKYETQKEFPLLNKNIDFLIPSVAAPIILIESSYNTTTGSGQSKRADQLVELYGVLMKHNANHRKNKIVMLNYCDGFGWIGRQNDLHRIYDASDFVFNRLQLQVLDEVLDTYFPKF